MENTAAPYLGVDGTDAINNDAEHLEEEAVELAAPLAPVPGVKFPGEIQGTIEGEDVGTHQWIENSEQ